MCIYKTFIQLSSLMGTIMIINHGLDLLNFIVFIACWQANYIPLTSIWIYIQLIGVVPMVIISLLLTIFWFTFATIHDLVQKKPNCKLIICTICSTLPFLVLFAVAVVFIVAFVSISAFGLISAFLYQQFTTKYQQFTTNANIIFLGHVLSFMQGKHMDHHDIKYENDEVMRALSVNHGYFNFSQYETRCYRDLMFTKYLNSIETDLFKVKMIDLWCNTKFGCKSETKDNLVRYYFDSLYFAQMNHYRDAYHQYWSNYEDRCWTDLVEHGVPYLAFILFTYALFPLYMVSRIAYMCYPLVVLLSITADIGLLVTCSLYIVGSVAIGVALYQYVWRIYSILIFNIGFGVLNMKFIDGCCSSTDGVFQYILNYYSFAQTLQVVKPIVIETFGDDIAGLIMHYWLCFDDIVNDYAKNGTGMTTEYEPLI
eukprot:251290_1